MICQNCHYKNPPDASFCQNCAHPLEQTCPNCATTNEPSAKFCKNCGTRLDKSLQNRNPPSNSGISPARISSSISLAGERRTVTILFADVVGSTSLAGRLDVEDWAEIMNQAFERMGQVIQRFGGRVSRLLGDALLATFGAPVAHEDDPIRATYAALNLLDVIQIYAQEIKRAYDIEFAIRVGMNTGLAVVGDIGGDQMHEYTAMGEAVNLAARLQSSANPMTTWISESTYRFISPVFNCQDMGELNLKGFPEPIKAYQVISPKRKPSRLRGLPGLDSPMVGRQTELHNLVKLSQKVQKSTGYAVLIVGDAGLGKSRLVDEWKRLIPSNIRWVEGQCLSYGQGLPYHLVINLLRNMFKLHSESGEETNHRKLKEAIQKLAPHIYQEIYPFLANLLKQDLDQEEKKSLDLLNPEDLQRAYIDALSQTLNAYSQHKPLAIILEDIHWSDPSSIKLLLNVLPSIREAPILICLVTRLDPDSSGWMLVEAVRESLQDRLTEIHLRSLSQGESNLLVSNLLETDSLPEDLRNLISQKAEGNPLFVEEVIRMLIDQDVISYTEGRWHVNKTIDKLDIPDNLQGLLLARIDRLPDDARQTLRVAAVIGRQFSVRLLNQVLEREIPV